MREIVSPERVAFALHMRDALHQVAVEPVVDVDESDLVRDQLGIPHDGVLG